MWRDNYRRASFRGIAFHAGVIESNYGRRQVTHEYPGLDKPYTEDLGREFNEFIVDGYVIGDDYQVARDALVKACRDTTGPGVLVHPYFGEVSVVCRNLRISESSEEGGMCAISMRFIEDGELLYPGAVADGLSAVDDAAAGVEGAAEAGFLAKYDVPGLPDFIADAAAAQIADVGAYFAGSIGRLDTALSEAATFVAGVDRLVSMASDFAANPFGPLSETILSARRLYVDAQIIMWRLGDRFAADYTGSEGTPNRIIQRDNHRAISGLVRQFAIAESARAIVRLNYASYDDALLARNEVADRIDDEAERTDDDAIYLALTGLRAAIYNSVPGPEKQLPRLRSYTPTVTVPALLLAYQLYGDASRDAEIVARNKIRNPCFVPGGVALQVLADA